MASGDRAITNFQYKFDSVARCESYRKYIEKQYDRDGFNGYYHAKGICVQNQEQKINP